jgi:glycosyltransferase involved in cell wall biosynthesis
MISITIATYNRCELLDNILSSLENQAVESSLFEVVVCDSHSTDNTENVINKHKKINLWILKIFLT